MNKLLWMILLLTVFTPLDAHGDDAFTIAISCPFESKCSAPELENMLTEAYARAGYAVRFQYMPRLRALHSADNGSANAVAVCSQEALSDFHKLKTLPSPILKVAVAAFSLNPAVSITRRRDLEKYTVGIIRGQYLTARLTEELMAKRHVTNTMKNLVSMLQDGRVDAILLSRTTARIFLAESNIHDYAESEPLATSYLYHAINISSYSSEQAERVNKALEDMIKDGTMARLYGRRADMTPPYPFPKNR
ncbi:substrate-binding periplasmic protein [Pseudodesulfovibrio senegalensis]|uniref:Amino acid ABC transporter substrate-binding protein n=1 Tax=Pseudodesulfovibrio senegalensis TaxID=1721087 RepID=A0A6N6N1N8_9BACT|nr:transporter substrate-binding domain-containing protein [Pseudodesulfovibrio senegalensis]KAB1440770.1 amino acid ABC transporter substrate-binding protein [Pseudodesulfovibrio senegalensis]